MHVDRAGLDRRRKRRQLISSFLRNSDPFPGQLLLRHTVSKSEGGRRRRRRRQRRRFIFTRSSFSAVRAREGGGDCGKDEAAATRRRALGWAGPGQERAISLSFFLALPRASTSFRTCGHSALSISLSFFLSLSLAVTAQASRNSLQLGECPTLISLSRPKC